MHEFQPVPGQLAGRLFRRGGSVAVPEEDVRCPRCDSTNTKFCYYNNYNLSQPRHFCRGCRRYWTKGGLLRNVPVGGGCRKPKRQVPVSSSSDLHRNGAGAHRDAKKARSSSPASAASTTPNTAGAAAAAAAHASGVSATAAGVCLSTFPADAQPRPRPMFADQEAMFASFFVSPLPAISLSPQPKTEDDMITPALTLAEQPSSASCIAADMAPFSARPGGAAMASAADWPPATAYDAGMFDLAGDTWSSYWNTAKWTTTDPDGTVYLP